ncbi:MAG: maleylpyruvate isomerase family mycothiol-dependent enzyme [Actinomycetia bacterium]|nr:maleylpyruvate isomerase family mycothiol-dependent enzyme [Actinomycetes bacterium]MCH9701442.1 maleylpyruvate isomerase family mycothiol-dependent enzyme [Actinomycetes bacterium]MCH9760939.1 maleylpyruvate isomerase family mycothiol-dependent enzyme [Actinomycetes bacterium]
MNIPNLNDYIEVHSELFDHYNRLCERLTEEQLGLQSLCPEWDLRGVISHVAGIESVLDGWAPSTETPPPFGKLAAFQAEAAGLDRATLAARVADITASRLAHLRSLDPAVLDVPSITPAGVRTYGAFLQIRIFDMWVHARDIAIPLGEQLDNSGLAAEIALAEVAGSFGYIVGKKIGLPDGMSIVFHVNGVNGGVERDLAVLVDGRARVVDAVDSPDVEVRTDLQTFMMLVAGRVDAQAQIDAGTITWVGDEQWGDTAARKLAYTM